MDIKEILIYMSDIKRKNCSFISNYLFNYGLLSSAEFDVWKNNQAVVFCKQEGAILRVFFAASDLNALPELLNNVPADAVLEYVKKGGDDLEPFLITNGFLKHATYIRRYRPMGKKQSERQILINSFLEEFYDPACGQYAVESDIPDIMELMGKVFDIYSDHFPSYEGWLRRIRNRWVLLYRLDGKIEALCAYQIEGKKYYGNYSFNNLSADILYSMEQRALREAIDRDDLNYQYAWFNKENHKALRRSRLTHSDGLCNYIYRKTGTGGL